MQEDLFYAKSQQIRRENDFSFPRETEVNSEQNWGRLYLQVNVQCTCTCLKLAKIIVSGPKAGQKWNQLRSPSFLQKSWFGSQWQLQVCPSYMCCLQTKLWELSTSKRAFSLYFYLMIWIRQWYWNSFRKKISWKHVGFDIVAGTEHQLTRPQKLKIGSETIFLNSKSKTNDPPNMRDLSPIENRCGIFKARAAMSKAYSRNLEYL